MWDDAKIKIPVGCGMVAWKWLFVGALLGGLAVILLFVAWKNAKVRKYRKPQVEVDCLLPDEKNDYLRHRLQTTLAVSEEYSSPDAEFLHAQKLLYSLGEKKLTAADSLIARKLRKEIGMYAAKEYFAKTEKGEIATLFSRILTLCAKYDI